MQEELECGHASVAKARHCLLFLYHFLPREWPVQLLPEVAPLLPHREGIDKNTQRLSFMCFRGSLDVAICSLRHTSRQVAVWECG